eukprot:jgi/Chrzof1/13131/Cz07g21030.t1
MVASSGQWAARLPLYVCRRHSATCLPSFALYLTLVEVRSSSTPGHRNPPSTTRALDQAAEGMAQTSGMARAAGIAPAEETLAGMTQYPSQSTSSPAVTLADGNKRARLDTGVLSPTAVVSPRELAALRELAAARISNDQHEADWEEVDVKLVDLVRFALDPLQQSASVDVEFQGYTFSGQLCCLEYLEATKQEGRAKEVEVNVGDAEIAAHGLQLAAQDAEIAAQELQLAAKDEELELMRARMAQLEAQLQAQRPRQPRHKLSM